MGCLQDSTDIVILSVGIWGVREEFFPRCKTKHSSHDGVNIAIILSFRDLDEDRILDRTVANEIDSRLLIKVLT
jgi:hypothetical protein